MYIKHNFISSPLVKWWISIANSSGNGTKDKYCVESTVFPYIFPLSFIDLFSEVYITSKYEVLAPITADYFIICNCEGKYHKYILS